MTEAPELVFPDAELILGLVAPYGTDLARVEQALKDRLPQFRYAHAPISLSEGFGRFDLRTPKRPESPAGRAHRKMDEGNALRNRVSHDAAALTAISAIRASRKNADAPEPRRVYVLRQLKHPREIETLRRVYGPGFFLLGVTAPLRTRIDYLRHNRGMSEDEAVELIERDLEEADTPHGQQTRDTFHLADAFVSFDDNVESSVWRILDLIFGHGYHTPTRDEHAMFMAYAASLRSADLSRQVGAAIMTSHGEVIATGANDVPTAGGGLYWPDEPPPHDPKDGTDCRDYVLEVDKNAERRDQMVVAIIRAIDPAADGQSDSELLAAGKARLRHTGLLDLTEFGRAVHAEMEALSNCGRVGISCRGATLYTTTFPCHNCTKHIVTAGIGEVVYVEPYPKSKAIELHGDAISVPALQTAGSEEPKIRFRPFQGVGPRRFIDLFSMTLGDGRAVKRKDGVQAVKFKREVAVPRVPMQPTTYFEREKIALAELEKLGAEKGAGSNDDQENGNA